MSSRPRRSAAQKASVAITDMADRDNMSSSRSSRRAGDGKGLASVSRSGQGDKEHTYLNVKLPASKLRQATTNRHGSSISVSSDSTPKRPARGGKKNYVVEDSDDDEDEDEGEDEIQVGAPAAVMADDDDDDDDDEEDEDMDDADEDADGEAVEDEMDVDAEGEDDEDADGEEDVDMTPAQPAPVIKISKPVKTSPSSKKTKQVTPRKAVGQVAVNPDNSDDDELSDLDSDDEDLNLGDDDAEGEEEDEDMDAEGEEIEDVDADGEPDEDVTAIPGAADLDSDEDGSRGGTPDLSKMTQRQRARFEGLDESHYQALSNEVQAKKTFTVEEKAMRRAEMARRRRNLSEKRNEEVKQETINKLLKKQASKTNRKNLAAIGEENLEIGEDGVRRPNPIFIRWTSRLDGNHIAIPGEIMAGPAGQLFVNAVRPSAGAGRPRKMIEEVS